MKKLKLLWMILKRTKATQILSGYIVFLFVSAAIIQLVEPDINHYGDALSLANWFRYLSQSTRSSLLQSLPVLLSIIMDRL